MRPAACWRHEREPGVTEPAATSGTLDGPIGLAPTPPELPDDFSWTGRYLVPDLDVEVPFIWNGRDGDFQMTAGAEAVNLGLPVSFRSWCEWLAC